MSYAARSDLLSSYMTERQLVICTNEGDGSAVSEVTAVTTAALEAASAEINGYLGARYELPLTVVPQALVGLACRIARYRLLSGGGSEPSEWVAKDYEGALKQLAEIRDGKFDLGLDADGAAVGAEAPARGRVRSGSVAPRFGRDKMRGY